MYLFFCTHAVWKNTATVWCYKIKMRIKYDTCDKHSPIQECFFHNYIKYNLNYFFPSLFIIFYIVLMAIATTQHIHNRQDTLQK